MDYKLVTVFQLDIPTHPPEKYAPAPEYEITDVDEQIIVNVLLPDPLDEPVEMSFTTYLRVIRDNAQTQLEQETRLFHTPIRVYYTRTGKSRWLSYRRWSNCRRSASSAQHSRDSESTLDAGHKIHTHIYCVSSPEDAVTYTLLGIRMHTRVGERNHCNQDESDSTKRHFVRKKLAGISYNYKSQKICIVMFRNKADLLFLYVPKPSWLLQDACKMSIMNHYYVDRVMATSLFVAGRN